MKEIDQTISSYHIEGFGILKSDSIDSDFKILSMDNNKMQILFRGVSYQAIIKKFDLQQKKATINVSGYDFDILIKEPIDHLIDKLGFLSVAKHVIKVFKSPMPGLIGNIFVNIGDLIEVGDKLLSLEAMKMENILKSTGSGVVKKINVSQGSAVEKNTILIEFE
jgi:biotin carboxyl carrier protein